MRQLASIQRIVDIKSIPDADKIDCASVLGWKCIVKKGEFKVGDLVIYIEPDSMLPFNPWTGELIPDKPLRLKTVKMKKQISQGLVLNIGLPQVAAASINFMKEGTDITALLGITKYEPPPPPAVLAGQARGAFPSFLVETDETRIQSIPGVLSRWPDTVFTVTEKIDGMSTSYYSVLEDGQLRRGACSRKLDLLTGESVQWKVAAEDKIFEALEASGKERGVSMAVQGELVGPNIQSNKLVLPSVQFFAFNLYDITNRRFLAQWELEQWCDKWSIKHTVVIAHSMAIVDQTVDSLVEFVTRKSLLNPQIWIEGGVFRPRDCEGYDGDIPGGRLSFKVINPQFLLKYEK